MKKIIALTLAVLIMISATVCSVSVFSAATTATLSYSFTGDEATVAGFAEGTISLKANDSSSAGNYYLYWADATKALDGYREIATLNVASGATGTYSMLEHTAIPREATQIIAIKATSEPTNKAVSNAAATYTIPTSKRLSESEAIYTFGAISDPQIANDSYGSSSYPNDEIHLAAAFETLSERDVDFTISSGDTVNDQNGNQTYAAEFKRYQKILADSSYVNPIYEANGNHDVTTVWNKTGGYYNDDTAFVKGTGLDSTVNTIKAAKPYYEITEPTTGDHFIFMALEGGFYTDRGTQFSTAQLDWLEGLLEKYTGDGKNIFIIQHGNIQGWGSGDKLTTPYYYDLGLNPANADVARFIDIMEEYKDCVVISGHTHLELSAHLNYSDNDGTSAVIMHNSAIGGVRRLVNGTIDRTAVLGMSEGYIVDVYSDCVIFKGTNMYSNEIMPDCTYIIPSSTSALEPTQATEAPTQATEAPTQATEAPTQATEAPTQATEAPTQATEAPTQDENAVTEGYYLVGQLNGQNLWSASDLTADRKLKTNPNTSAEYYINWTFYAGDELKIVHFNGTGIDKWFNDGGDNYKIGATSNKVGKCILYFNPDGRTDWSYTWFTVQPDTSVVDPTQETDAPTQVTEATKATDAPTEATEVQTTMYGDVDLDNEVTVIDATMIQREIAQLIEFTDAQFKNANVDGDDEITIIDATMIQRFIAQLIGTFPIENTKSVATTSADDVSTLLATAKSDLSTYYTYSSYDQYQALKKVVKELTSSGDTSQTAYNNLNNAYTGFWAILEALGVATGDTIDVYFTNVVGWSTVNYYVWNDSSNNSWPGEAMDYVETNDYGQKVYKCTLETGKYTNIIFNNGSAQTVDLTLSNINNEGFYTTTTSSGKYLCETYVYGE